MTGRRSSNERPPISEEHEIQHRADEVRRPCELASTLAPGLHFERPVARPLLPEERNRTTILFGGLNWRHDKLVKAVFQGDGYRCENLPTPTLDDFELGRKYCSNGQCNPVYFTAGAILNYLKRLQDRGLTRQEIIDNYVYYIPRSCGPCRFGMYEADYRYALENAGFGGFRIVSFELNRGARQEAGAGIQYSLNFGLGILNALQLGDILYDLAFQIRPYEVHPGETDRVLGDCLDRVVDYLRDGKRFEISKRIPPWLYRQVKERKLLKLALNKLGKLYTNLYGSELRQVLCECRSRIDQIEIDRTRVKPIVKVTGEIFAHLTEGDGNHRMYSFLEQEGAQVQTDLLSAMAMHLLNQSKVNLAIRKRLDAPYPGPRLWEAHKALLNQIAFAKRYVPIVVSEWFYDHHYRLLSRALGGMAHPLVPPRELAELAHTFYHSQLKGGESYLEVGKNIYYTVNHLCHMFLTLKPFGCMPSTQSDGVQSAVVERYKDMIYLPIETAGCGAVLARSRVQMALGDAKAKARIEFEKALASTGKRLEDIREYVAEHPRLRRPFCGIPRDPGTAGVAANFVRYVSDLMDGKARLPRT